MLTKEQRDVLEAFGPETVRMKLTDCGPGRMAYPPAFAPQCGEFLRGDIEDWLVEKYAADKKVAAQNAVDQASTLRWAKIAGRAGIISAVVGVAGVIVGILALP